MISFIELTAYPARPRILPCTDMASATLSKARQDSSRVRRLWTMELSSWERIGLAAMCAAALIGYFAYPTYPTYDSFYALLWGRDLLHLHLPDLQVYRAPTEHPLAIAFGMICSLFGQYGARLMVLGSIASFVALVAGSYRLGRLCCGPVVGLCAALLALSRFFVENLAAQGYLDITYVALIVWAIALEVQRPRRGPLVLWLLAAAGLLRPDAWALSGAYWVWCAWPRRGGASLQNRKRLQYLGITLIGPVVWVLFDAIVTGDPLHSLHATAELAQELERSQGLSSVLASVWSFGVRIDKLAVVLGVLVGLPVAVWLAPRRVLTPLAALAVLVGVFVAEGVAGASVVDRYMMGAAVVALLFCAVTIGGWAMLEPGSALRRIWMAGAVALVIYGAISAATTLSLSNLRTTLAYHEDFHEGLATALKSPNVRAALQRCPVVSLPDNKLIPDARWILGATNQRNILARSQALHEAAEGNPQLRNRLRRGSVAVYPLGSAVFFEAIVDFGDDPLVQVPEEGYRRIYTSRYYAVYDNC
jgi:hypothetical protein